MEARIVGTASEIDLALLKVDAKGLRAMPFADYHRSGRASSCSRSAARGPE